MDVLSRLLDAPRGRDAYLVRTTVERPWSIRLSDRAPLGLVAVLQGSAWVSSGDGAAVRLDPGGVMVAKGPADAMLGHRPVTDIADVQLLPGLQLVDREGRDVTSQWTLGHRHLGNNPRGRDILLMGCYRIEGEVTQRLLKSLPSVIQLPAGEIDTPLLPLLANEIAKDSPGQTAVLDRLFDLLLVAVLRQWVTRGDRTSAGPYLAQSDPVVGPALTAIHTDPAHGWTVAALAARAGVSRASLAQRFTKLVGEPPMSYLTGWRIALAADLLLEPTATIDRVARSVGYSSPFALSAAFKRERGITPSEHRSRSMR